MQQRYRWVIEAANVEWLSIKYWARCMPLTIKIGTLQPRTPYFSLSLKFSCHVFLTYVSWRKVTGTNRGPPSSRIAKTLTLNYPRYHIQHQPTSACLVHHGARRIQASCILMAFKEFKVPMLYLIDMCL